jgi:glycosyltransferase involved in cell wall biosynthesis
MDRKKLLFVSPRFLFPADCGGKIRSRDILRGLKGGPFHITLVSPAPARASHRFAQDLGRVCDRFVSWPETRRGVLWKLKRGVSLLSRLPVSVASDRSGPGRKIIAAELARRPDLLVGDFIHSTILLPQRFANASVLFTHNVEADIFRRHAAVASNPLYRAVWKSQAMKMQRLEYAASRRFDAVVAVSEHDAESFRAVRGQDRVIVIPTGVDLDYFQYQAPQTEAPRDHGTVVFTGSMDWLPNVDGIRYFMDEVWPLIARSRPKAKMVVVGHSPPKDLVRASQDRGLAWTFTGFVDDVRPHCRNAGVYVIPLRVGGGTRMKVYEAMSMGCPVVSTSVGIEGLPLVSNRDCIITDSAKEFAAAVLQILANPTLRRTLTESARRLVERNFSVKAAAAVFEDACRRAISLGDSHSDSIDSQQAR